VARVIEEIYQDPRCGEVYNLGGGRQNACSILEAVDWVEQATGKKMHSEYMDQNCQSDHICYISNLTHFQSDSRRWEITKSLNDIFREIVEAWKGRLAA